MAPEKKQINLVMTGFNLSCINVGDNMKLYEVEDWSSRNISQKITTHSLMDCTHKDQGLWPSCFVLNRLSLIPCSQNIHSHVVSEPVP